MPQAAAFPDEAGSSLWAHDYRLDDIGPENLNPTDVICNMGEHAAGKLRYEIANSHHVPYQFDQFVNDADDGAQLIAAYDLEPTAVADIPEQATLKNGRQIPGWKIGEIAQYCANGNGQHVFVDGANTRPN